MPTMAWLWGEKELFPNNKVEPATEAMLHWPCKARVSLGYKDNILEHTKTVRAVIKDQEALEEGKQWPEGESLVLVV